ncbi:MAG TPA: PAS domain-containing protein [Microcoleaceae cyanobacterium]|jgi:hypothetical protein
MLHPDSEIWSSHATVASPWQVIKVLGHLQAQSNRQSLSSVYIYDLVNQCNICSSLSIARLLGYSSNDPLAMEELGFAHLIHPDDLEQVAVHFQRFTALTAGDVIEVTYRMRRSDGKWCWLHSQETLFVQTTDGFPLQVLGLIQAVTDDTWKSQCGTAQPIQHLSNDIPVLDRIMLERAIG